MTLDTAHKRKIVTAASPNKGWGALCEGKPTFGLWSKEESGLHINCLEMFSVCQAGQFFLSDIRGHHVLVRSDSRSMVSFINPQGGLVSKRLCTLANDLLVWAQNNLSSLKATHVPGKMNQVAEMLSKNNVSSEEWMLHPLAVQTIWEVFGRALVDLLANDDNSHCPIFLTKSTHALPHKLPMISPQSLCYLRRVSEHRQKLKEPTVGVRVILIWLCKTSGTKTTARGPNVACPHIWTGHIRPVSCSFEIPGLVFHHLIIISFFSLFFWDNRE